MDPRLLNYYNRELQFIREMGGEFAREFPKIAGRLGIEGFACADPYVERLLEGFAFLASRIQLRIDDEFPRFTQHLLEMIYPHYLAATPSMAVVQFQPDLAEGELSAGFRLPRQTLLRGRPSQDDATPCEYRTSHEVTLWPLEIVAVDYFNKEAGKFKLPDRTDVKAAFHFQLRSTAGLTLDEVEVDNLPIYLRGVGETPFTVYEQMLGNSLGLLIRPASEKPEWQEFLDSSHIRPVGFDDVDSLLPVTPQSFHGYRLLEEYFSFPSRFLFVELASLRKTLRRCKESVVDVFVLLDSHNRDLDGAVDKSYFSLFCSPAINLFPKRMDRIHVNDKTNEFHVVPDRMRSVDFEIFNIKSVTGHYTREQREQKFRPFYEMVDCQETESELAFYTIRRDPRVLSNKQRRYGARSSYVGSEIFISLVDGREAPYSGELDELSLTALCTNRDLPMHMPLGLKQTDFTLEISAPVNSVRCMSGPTRPSPSPCHRDGENAWRLINHLSLNYLSLVDNDTSQGATALREMLKLYGSFDESTIQKQIDGVRSVKSNPVIRPLMGRGPMTFGRGIEVEVTLEESAFEGSGAFLLGAVLDQFFSKYVSINSFTETVIRTIERGRIMKWPTRIGRRKIA